MQAPDAALSAPIVADLEKGLDRIRSHLSAKGDVHSPVPFRTVGSDDGCEGKDAVEPVVDEPPIPKNNLWVVMPSLGLVCFISALDASIISTAMPTIAAEFNASPSEYSWIVTSYLLAQTLMSPINGRVTDIVGRKPALYASIIVLLVFSAMCGAAKNVTWLIVCRALTGIGGGSIVSLT